MSAGNWSCCLCRWVVRAPLRVSQSRTGSRAELASPQRGPRTLPACVSDPVPPVSVAHVTSPVPVADDFYLDGTSAETCRLDVFRNVDVYLPATDLSAGILDKVVAGIRAGTTHANPGTEGQNRRIGGYDSWSRWCAGRGLASNGIRRRREVGLLPGRLRGSHGHARPATANLGNRTQAECHDKVPGAPGTAGHWGIFVEWISFRHEAHRPGRLAQHPIDLLFFTLCIHAPSTRRG